MNDPLFRAFLFLHPDFDRTKTGSGLSLAPTGGVAMVEGHAAIRQSVLLLLSTFPGERSGWLRRDLVGRLRDDSGLPVEHVVVDPVQLGVPA